MKLLIPALVFASSPAFASFQDESPVLYLSWCENNSVMGQDDQANPVVRYTCTEQQTCQTIARYKIDRTIITGACVDKNK